MRHEFPGRCPGLVYDAPSGLFHVFADQTASVDQTCDKQRLPGDAVTELFRGSAAIRSHFDFQHAFELLDPVAQLSIALGEGL